MESYIQFELLCKNYNILWTTYKRRLEQERLAERERLAELRRRSRSPSYQEGWTERSEWERKGPCTLACLLLSFIHWFIETASRFLRLFVGCHGFAWQKETSHQASQRQAKHQTQHQAQHHILNQLFLPGALPVEAYQHNLREMYFQVFYRQFTPWAPWPCEVEVEVLSSVHTFARLQICIAPFSDVCRRY